MMGAESRRWPDQRGTRDPSFSEQREDFAIKEIVASSRVLVQMNCYFFATPAASIQFPP
jgi:hypothetical protein